MDLSSLLDDDEELTPLFDADIPRVDLVAAPASGAASFILAKQDEASAGLLDPEFVRDLIAKADPEPDRRERETLPNGITVSGSPADIAAFIHKAAERDRERETVLTKAEVAYPADEHDVALSKYVYDRITKAEKYDAAARKKMAGSGAAMKDGSYPIADEEDLTKAIRAVGRGGSSHNAIRAHIIRRAKSLGKSSLIPDTWASDGSLKEGSVSKTAAVAKADVNPDLDDGRDGLDPTVPLAEPDEMGDGSPTEPGSPAWESIDAATASKWCSILARARVAVDLLAEREMLEAASADPDDAEHACELQDVCCAIDYAISILAPFAVAEQSEADSGEMAMAKSAPDPDTWTAISKAMADEDGTAAALGTLEALGAVIRKSGRVLSSVNEAHIREAAARLNTVLSSLPKAPVPGDGEVVAKMTPETEADMPDAKPSTEVTADSGQSPAMGTAEPPLAAQEAVVTKEAGPVLAVGLFDHARRLIGLADPAAIHTDLTAVPVAKAETGDGKAPMCVVYNQAGKLIGIVDPADITPVANSEAEPDDTPEDAAEAAPDAGDMTPAPPADAGTPAEDVAKGTPPEAQEDTTDTRTVLKSIVTEALAEILGAQGPAQDVAKQADVAELSGTLRDVLARLETVEKQDARPGVFASGATPPPGSVPPARPSLRGQDQGASVVIDVAKAREMKQRMYTADPAEANRIAKEMNLSAIASLEAIHAAGRH